MQTILITGSNGFVGKHLVDELRQNGYKTIGIDRNASLDQVDTTSKVLELMNIDQVKKIDFKKIDGVIHLAGLAAVGPSFEDPMKYLNTNMGIEVNLFEAALSQNAKPKFIVISSGSLYGNNSAMPLTEDSTVLASSPYAVSKIGQEQLALYYKNRGFECFITRPFNHIGPGQGLGFLVPDLAKQIVEVELGLKNNISVGNLESKRDYTDVRDIVRAYRLVFEKGKSGETYNICSGVAYSGQDILNSLSRLAIKNIKVVQDESKLRPSDSPILFGSNKKITKDTGWLPNIKLEKTLSDVLDDWRNKV